MGYIIDYLKLIIFDGILGYGIQSASYALLLFAQSKRKINWKQYFIVITISSLFLLLVRNISFISYGVHTLLYMIVVILLGVFLMKISIRNSVISVLETAVIVTIVEGALLYILKFSLGNDYLNEFVEGNFTYSFLSVNSHLIQSKINKAFMGLPTNVVLISIITIIYKIRIRKPKGIKD